MHLDVEWVRERHNRLSRLADGELRPSSILDQAGTQFEIKINPPRQAQEWSYSSHRESIGKALSSPDIRYKKKAHINCGSSARMAGNVCANVDQIRRQGRWNNITINGAYLTNLLRELVRLMAGFPTYVRFFYLARAALNPPTSLCEKLFPAIDD
ncbi:hypothetical protein [Absidia glauca]|uniref:Ndc10 domain-containing protein n=1 Tax=Absidia glauca TaxID=4829 RepID=A0A168L8K4_ABSGL|nr:hypothetical protein [Absidia glauca]